MARGLCRELDWHRPDRCAPVRSVQSRHPIVYLLACRILGQTVPLLEFALELVTLSGNPIEIIVREISPLLLDLAL